jgi:hypothetical protein
MRPRLATPAYPFDEPRKKEDTQPFDLRRVKASHVPGASAVAVKPHLPPPRANVVVGGLPSVMIEDAPDLRMPRRRWF